jgi:hypothetical protein
MLLAGFAKHPRRLSHHGFKNGPVEGEKRFDCEDGMVVNAPRSNNELGRLDTASLDTLECARKAMFPRHVLKARTFEDRPALSWPVGTSTHVFPATSRKFPDAPVCQHQAATGSIEAVVGRKNTKQPFFSRHENYWRGEPMMPNTILLEIQKARDEYAL